MPHNAEEREDLLYWCRTCEKVVTSTVHRANIGNGSTVQCPTLAVRMKDGLPVTGIPSRTSPEALEGLLTLYMNEPAERNPERAMTPWRRQRTMFDFTDCGHQHLAVTVVGGWELHVCNRCAHVVRKFCTHPHSTWHADDRILICDTCGSDGT
jgi:hypothetical protein